MRAWLAMTWRDVLFAHWPVDPATVADRLPAGVDVATRGGDAYLSVVAFDMAEIGPRGLPFGRSFPELNLRTYVERSGERGVYFFNLDAADRLGVRLARSLYALPYYEAEARVTREDGTVRFASRRTHEGGSPARFDATYRPTGEPAAPEPGSLAQFLTENYRFYTAGRALYRGDIAHEPWPLQSADLDVRSNTLFGANGFEAPDGEPLVHYAADLDVRAGLLRRAGAAP